MIPLFFLQNNGQPKLKSKHNYYYQLQGLMSTCNVKWADFIVYTKKETFSERVYFDEELWFKIMLPKLTAFYFTFIYPEIVKSTKIVLVIFQFSLIKGGKNKLK